MILFLLILFKFPVYWLVFKFTPKILSFDVADTSAFAFKWASVRLGIGLLFGIFMGFGFWALQNKGANGILSYAITFGLGRYLEWAIVYTLMMKTQRKSLSFLARKAQIWLAIGTSCNVAIDIIVINSGITKGLRFVC